MAKEKTDLQVFQEWVQELTELVFGKEEKPKRARTKGRYKADDPTTKDVNEAWVGGKAPKKKKK
jgi:secreted trypsin-like serine protease